MPYVRVYVKSKTDFCESDILAAQSPINIILSETKKLRPPVHLCYCNYFDRREYTVSVINDGKTAKVTLPGILKEPVLKCGPLKDEYVFEKVEFRWGECEDNGSEHSINGKKFDCECQLVHFNKKYESFDEAKEKNDGLVIVAIMMESCDVENKKLEPLIDAIFRVPCKHTEYTYTSRCFFDWLEDVDLNEYVTYSGSQTSEPFTESVKWFVIINPLSISENQMAAFRYIHVYKGRHRIKCNAREIQIPPEGLEIEYTGDLKPKPRKIETENFTVCPSVSSRVESVVTSNISTSIESVQSPSICSTTATVTSQELSSAISSKSSACPSES